MANAVAIILYNGEEILLQKRDEHAKKYPNSWGLFGGSIKDTESPLEGLKREIFEELSYKVHAPRLFYEINIDGDGRKFFFAEPYDVNQSLVLREGQDMKWFPTEKLKDVQIVPHHQKALSSFVQVQF